MTNETYDKYGNRLTCMNGTIFLHLVSGMKKTIGTLSEQGTVFRCYRKAGVHTFNKSSSIGFNYRLITKGVFSFVEVVLSDGSVLQTTRENIITKGKMRMFKNQGYELQIFLDRKDFNGYNEYNTVTL